MEASGILLLIAGYFGVLILISYLTGKRADNATFFKANNTSPWYLVAFGMIGASLSGVTFISVPGWVEAQSMGYMQMVLGYVLGYATIGLVLLPLYYRLNLTSIYTYLEDRFGRYTYKTGASFFLLSRTVGAAFRLFLIAKVLQLLLFDEMGIPFWATVTITILLIWLYTFKGGIKTIVWTDTLQTLCMLIAVGVCIYSVAAEMHIASLWDYVADSQLSKTFFFEDFKAGNYFWKQFFSGAFIAVVMTGLDQDMMQKNLTCKSLKDAQRNMFWFTIVLVIVNFFFLALGVLLTDYAQKNGIDVHKDELFPIVATEGRLGMATAVFFLLGLIAAAYSSADSALTSLTTSFSIDILGIEREGTSTSLSASKKVRIRKWVHILFSLILIITILVFKYVIARESVIAKIFTFAGYTYGPLLGLYAFGLFTKWNVRDKAVPYICVLAPVLTLIITLLSTVYSYFFRITKYPSIENTWACALEFAQDHYYVFGFEILVMNGLITILGLYLFKK